MRTYILPFVCLMILASCQEENEIVYSVDPALAPYVTTFYNEAAERGIILPKNLIAEFSQYTQAISKADTEHGQNYVYFKPQLFDSFKSAGLESKIEAEIFNRMAQVFMKRNLTYQSDKEAMFNAAFD